jgi:hypothetical protein
MAHGRYIAVTRTPERELVPVREWPVHDVAAINFCDRFKRN